MRQKEPAELTAEMRATPRDQWPEDWIFDRCIELAHEFGLNRETVLQPRPVYYALSWVSPGVEGEKAKRIRERVIRHFWP